ncbi:hypothetical protein Tco_0246723 [Tanacetum coccineum]
MIQLHSLPLPPPIILSHTRPDAPSLGTPPFLLPSTNRIEDRPKVTLLPQKRLSITLGPTYEGTPVVTDVVKLSQRMTEFETRVRRDTDEVYMRDRRTHARTARLMETEARMSREVMSLRTTVLAQQSQIRELQSADRRRQTVITEMLAADHRMQKQLTEALKLIKRLQTQMAEFERQQGPAKGPAQPKLPEEAGSSS